MPLAGLESHSIRLVVAELAGFFLRIQKVTLFGRAVGVVAEAAFLQDVYGVGMRFREAVFGVASEAATLEAETAAAADAVTLRAFGGFERRMLQEWLELRGRVGSDEEADFLAAAFPHERQDMFTPGGSGRGVEYVGKRLAGFDWLAVEFEAPRGRGGDDIDDLRGQGRAIDRAQDLAFVLSGRDHGQQRGR